MEAGANIDVIVDPSRRDEDLDPGNYYNASPITSPQDIINAPHTVSVLELLHPRKVVEIGRPSICKGS